MVNTSAVCTLALTDAGGSHALMGNVDKRLLWRLAVPGVIGGVAGAYFLTQVPGDAIKPFVYAYLLLLAVFVLLRSLGRFKPKGEVMRVGALGLFAGFLDASGGGGWGPVATSTLLARGGNARKTIGTVSAAEFAVSLAISAAFLLTIGLRHFEIVLGLLVGGVLAAPLAAHLVRRLPERGVLTAVGMLVMAISTYQIAHAIA